MFEKRVFGVLLVFVLMLLSLSFVSAQLNDCRIEGRDAIYNDTHALYGELNVSYQKMGYVSMQGRFASYLNVSRVLYPYGLFCDKILDPSRPDAGRTFYFSDPNAIVGSYGGVDFFGSGMVSFTNAVVNFGAEANLGFRTDDCKIVSGGASCDAMDVCVFRLSNLDQGFISDCNNQSMPYENLFQHRLCCTPSEICNDGIDNTGDGLIDCASPDCHANVLVGSVAQRCDPPGGVPGNNQMTADCVDVANSEPGNVVFFDHCRGPRLNDVGFTINDWPIGFHNLYDYPATHQGYYCNYGETDDPADEPLGYCCPQGQWYKPDQPDGQGGLGACVDFIPCTNFCPYSFITHFSSAPGWLSSIYDDTPWCHSHLPAFTTRTITRSDACCPVVTHGTFGFYIVDDNVKIFGYE